MGTECNLNVLSDNTKQGGWLIHQMSVHHSEGPGQAQEVG